MEALGDPLRQYIVAKNNEEKPFTRDERRWIYSSAKKQNNYFGFGTDNDLENAPNYLVIKQSTFPKNNQTDNTASSDLYALPCQKKIGGHRQRSYAFTPGSLVYVSGMSYGSLGKTAVTAMNKGCQLAGALHNTGEGGVSPYHKNGSDLIWQIGTGYFGCRDNHGNFDIQQFVDVVQNAQVRAIEIKLSQGAKPGLGGRLPGKKVTAEISRIRGIPVGQDCNSPACHTAFTDTDSMLDFVELLAQRTGLPIGIKSAVGDDTFWDRLASLMETGTRGVDFIAIDGGEGGTGAGPLAFADHVGLPFKVGFPRVYSHFKKRGLDKKVVFVGAGKLGFPEVALLALAMGCDMIAVGREAMLSIGCIQAQLCHTGHCPSGVTTHNKWLMRGLDPTNKSARLANYIINLRKELLQLAGACGYAHPSEVPLETFEIVNDRFGSTSAADIFRASL